MASAKKRLEQLNQSAKEACKRGRHGMEVEVIVWPMSAGDVGHVALRIGDLVLGYYPTDINGDGRYTSKDLSNSPGSLHVDTIREAETIYKGDKVFVISLNIDCETLICLTESYVTLLGKLGTYSVTSRNCTTIVADALAHCGLDMTATFDYPASKYGDLVLTTPGKVKIVKAGICMHTVQVDHQSVISPNAMKGRLEGKPFVIQIKEEVVGE